MFGVPLVYIALSAADGSLTIYIQHELPWPDKEANWLPAPKGEIGFLTLRLYVPKQQVIDGVWKPQPVMEVK